MVERIIKYGLSGLLLLGLLVWYGFWLATPINLATADLGRHITNGRLLLNDWGKYSSKVLQTNFYSYTQSDFRFVNHHWGTGVVFYLVHKWWSWTGVHLLFIGISLMALAVYWDVARRLSNVVIASIVLLPLVPLIGSRVEVRPEAFSYLFFGLFLWLLLAWREKWCRPWVLWWLPVLGLVWVNLHVFFWAGLLLVGLFIVDAGLRAWWQKGSWTNVRYLLKVFAVLMLALMVNPFGWKILLYPLSVFGHYGYDIVENKSILFLENWGQVNPNFLLIKLLTMFFIIGLVWQALWRKIDMALALVAGVTLGVGWLAIRNFPLTGLGFLSWGAGLMGHIPWRRLAPDQFRGWLMVTLLFLVVGAGTYFYYFDEVAMQKTRLSLGLLPNINAAADFMRANKTNEPIFNNYDIGGYLIYNFAPDQQVFVDNRPEAYSVDFFQEVYKPMQGDEKVWQQELGKYQFQTIVFYRHDLTEWAQKFLIARVQDTEWVPVFVDYANIIFVRDRPENKGIIARYAIPREVFSVQGQ